jgi:hypothetical protein
MTLGLLVFRHSLTSRMSFFGACRFLSTMAATNPRVFFDITIGGRAAGRIEMTVRFSFPVLF